ncbi:unnamed protein product [Rotaria magnacalcarata]|uniref:Uncharacterized protein n=2 Tax=Rotaria TaxID=231623 RepID=A0A819FEX7_9BILA|nr:unnamed protein product [Rotaria magnacalcarata]
MADPSKLHYTPGRGFPCYLLDRIDDDSSNHSDGASTIFIGTHSSSITTENSDTWGTISTLSNSSLSNLTTIDTMSGSLRFYDQNLLQYQSNVNMLSMGSELYDSRNTQSHITLSFDNNSLTNSMQEPAHELTMLSNVSVMDTWCSIPVCLTKDQTEAGYGVLDDPYYSNKSTGVENMFPEYVRLLPDSEEEPEREKNIEDSSSSQINSEDVRSDTNDVPSRVQLIEPKFDNCCLWGNPNVAVCDGTSRYHPDWPLTCVKFSALRAIDVRSYLKNKKIISHKEEDDFIINERNLIANRLKPSNILIDDSMSICPKHRSSYGIDWYDVRSTCRHPDHDSKAKSSARDCRRANINICSKIEGFPVGGRICSKHRKQILEIRELESVGPISPISNFTGASTLTIDNSLRSMNRILDQVNLSPIRSQTKKRLGSYSKGGIRRIKWKLATTMKVIGSKMADALAPGQGETLLQIVESDSQIKNIKSINETMSNEMIQNLKRIYDFYVEHKMPFIEQVRLLSMLPRSWDYQKIIDNFGASRHAIKEAHKMYDTQQYISKEDNEKGIRLRVDPEKVKHFVNWLVERTYGLTILRMDSGEKYELPRQILQLQKAHVVLNYKKYCDESDFDGLCRTKLYDILNSIKPSQQQAVSGLDEFLVEGVEAWRSLAGLLKLHADNLPILEKVERIEYNMVQEMAIPQADRKHLLKQMDMAESYQKSRHINHCSVNSSCATHCCTFSLSDPNCEQLYSACTQEHNYICSDCINIIETLDEIRQKIEKMRNPDLQAEAKNDFKNTSEHIMEWLRHNLRAAQQDFEKKRIISKMGTDEVFGTFDWGQKILPQEYRESQKKYFGKKGMSVFIGLFVWKDVSSSTVTASVTTSSAYTFSTQSYIVAITNAAQTEIDTLSAGELVLQQFQADYPQIKKLHKRTDNGTSF